MSLKHYKPITPTLRERVSIDYRKDNIWRGSPLKSLLGKKTKTGGRANTGKISSFHKSGGHKQRYRKIDFHRKLYNVLGTVIRIEYDPNRSAYIALIAYENGELTYIIAPHGLSIGSNILCSISEEIPIQLGNTMPLKNVPVGTNIHNIEISPKRGGQLARSAGTFCRLLKKDKDTALLRLSSGQQITVSSLCLCTIGIVSKLDYTNINKGKAGRSRWLGISPTVRGVAMNPIDHPHGGGEGRTSGGRCSVTPWGLPTKGYKTKRKKHN